VKDGDIGIEGRMHWVMKALNI